MKARTIKKLRKKIAQFKSYEVYEAIHLFGEPFEFKLCVKSDSPKNALKRFWKYFYRKNKMRHRWVGYDYETTYDWGKFMVKTENGFKYFYR